MVKSLGKSLFPLCAPLDSEPACQHGDHGACEATNAVTHRSRPARVPIGKHGLGNHRRLLVLDYCTSRTSSAQQWPTSSNSTYFVSRESLGAVQTRVFLTVSEGVNAAPVAVNHPVGPVTGYNRWNSNFQKNAYTNGSGRQTSHWLTGPISRAGKLFFINENLA
jgi:hypothetical protein